MSDLKPCPFCGGEAETVGDDILGWMVECMKCGAHTMTCCDTEAEAIAAWNARAERTCHNMSYRVDESRFHCSECEFGCWVRDVADGRDKLPRYCPNCGMRVKP